MKDIYIMGEDPTTCPKCGARTDFVELPDGKQEHTCSNCDYVFLVEDEEE